MAAYCGWIPFWWPFTPQIERGVEFRASPQSLIGDRPLYQRTAPFNAAFRWRPAAGENLAGQIAGYSLAGRSHYVEESDAEPHSQSLHRMCPRGCQIGSPAASPQVTTNVLLAQTTERNTPP